MAQKELTLHPETGALAEVVRSYQGVELGQLENEVQSAGDAAAIATAELLATPADADALLAAATKRNEALAALEDSKSTLKRGQELVGQPAAGVDPGADGTGGEVPAEVAGENF